MTPSALSPPKKRFFTVRFLIMGLLLLATLLAVLMLVVIFWFDTILRKTAEVSIRQQTGLKATIGTLRLGLRHPGITIKEFVLYNPPQFGNAPMLKLSELYVKCNLDELKQGKLHCSLVRFNLAEFNIVEDRRGKRNLDYFQNEIHSALDAGTNNVSHGSSAKLEFAGIDKLILTLGKVTFRELSDPGKVNELILKVDHQEFENINSEDDFTGMLLILLLRSDANFQQPVAGTNNWLQLLTPATNSKTTKSSP